jgi:hypothetical protein
MARPAGANVHVGKAAAIIVVALALGFLVLNDNSSGSFRAAASTPHVSVPDNFSETGSSSTTTPTTTASERQPAQIKVIAINATGRSGVAGQATTKLRNAGYNALAPGNATAAVTSSHPVSAVYVVTPGYNKEALTVASLFGLPDSAVKPLPNPSPSADIRSDTNIAVLVGSGITLP